ncbi:Uncharacterised protein [Kytococcus sedentarius]|nr:Uncharacterised protein [Kytococcus sedentarius]
MRGPAPARAGTERRAAELLAAVGLEQPGHVRPRGHDAGGVHLAVHLVVVLLDLLEVRGVAEARGLEEVPQVGREHRHRPQRGAVALEVPLVHRVEAHQRGEQPDVGLGDVLAHQVAAVGQVLLQPVQRRPEPVVGVLVGLLVGREAAAVDAVVHLGVDALHDRVHLGPQRLGVQVRRPLAVVRGPLAGEVERQLCEVVGDHLPGGHLHHRRDGDAQRVVGHAGVVALAQPVHPEHGVEAVGIEVEVPGGLAVHGVGQAQGDDLLQAQQAAHDDGAVRPRAGPCGDQPVAAGLHRPGHLPHLLAGRAGGGGVGGDAVGEVAGVSFEGALTGRVAGRGLIRGHVFTVGPGPVRRVRRAHPIKEG